jgi:hypothetical protein
MVGASLFGGRAMAGDWSHGSDSSCAGSSQEDPVHLRWDRIYFQANGAGYGNARGANYENDKYWSATGSGSSTSYFNYNDGSGCNNQAQWSSNHAAVDDGSHIRQLELSPRNGRDLLGQFADGRWEQLDLHPLRDSFAAAVGSESPVWRRDGT